MQVIICLSFFLSVSLSQSRRYECNACPLAAVEKFAVPCKFMLLLQLPLHSGEAGGLLGSVGAWTPFDLNSECSQSTADLLAYDVTHQASYCFKILVWLCLCVYTVWIKGFVAVSGLVISTRVQLERDCQQVKDDQKFFRETKWYAYKASLSQSVTELPGSVWEEIDPFWEA